jgi:hypothetical protein
MKKACLSCGNSITGRTDKKYCNNLCKNDFHNSTQLKVGAIEKMVSAAIRRNRKILESLFLEGQRKLDVTQLEHYGFSFKGLTGIEENGGKESRFFCYEYSICRKGRLFELQKLSVY